MLNRLTIERLGESTEMSENAVQIGRVGANEKLGKKLHIAAKCGNRKKLKKILAKGIHVDYSDSNGQTALFCACYEKREKVVDILLSHGANPNEKSDNGATPVHVAALCGNLNILSKLLLHNGDLRLHDNEGYSVKDWALMQHNPKKRLKIVEFLEKTRLFALTRSGHDLGDITRKGSLNCIQKDGHTRENAVVRVFHEVFRRRSSVNLDQLKSAPNLGYGKVYVDSETGDGFMCSLPFVNENLLIHDSEGTTYDSGIYTEMQSMLWKHTKVTAKKLHREMDSLKEVDLLIKEAHYMGKIRHPNLLLLMGVCQTNNLDGIVLLYESVACGSLFYHLHQKAERLHPSQILEMSKQICCAVLFLHEQNLIHCYITSYAINIVNPHQAKLGNFEYMVTVDHCEMGKKSLVSSQSTGNVAYNWMAPDIIDDCPPCFASDMYSYCCVLWEMIKNEIPWEKYSAQKIRKKVLQTGESLPVDTSCFAEKYNVVLQHGLQKNPVHRLLNFSSVHQILQLPDQDVMKYVTKFHQKRKPKSEKQKVSVKIRNSARQYFRETVSPDSVDEEMTEYNEVDSKPLGKRIPIWSDCNQNGNRYGQQDSDSRFVDEMRFTHKNVSWKLQEEQEGDKYYYTVGVKGSPYKELQHSSPETSCKYDEKQFTESESELESFSQTKHTVEQPELQQPLTRKYSYLEAQQRFSPTKGNCMVKPASHCTAGNVEKPVEKQLTTAGSIYALYNSFYGDEECKTPGKMDNNKRNPYSTMPRKRKRMGATPDMRPREEYCPGRGSVRNLVELYQTQENVHMFQQAVLSGQAKEYTESSVPRSPVHPKNVEFYRSEEKEKDTKSLSQDTKSQNQSKGPGNIPTAPPLYPIIGCNVTACISSTTTSSSTSQESNVTESSSVESTILDRWVSQSLQRCQNSLTDEIFNELASKAEDELTEESAKVKKQHKKKKNNTTKNNKKKEKNEIEEFYFDDDLRNKNIKEESHMKLQKAFLPGKSMQISNSLRSSFHDIPSKLREPDPSERNNRMTKPHSPPPHSNPRYVPATSVLQYEKIKKDCEKRGAFQSTVMIQSSSRDPDTHVVTHTLTDLGDGTTSTLYGKTVQASNIVSAHYVQDSGV
ncbi:uncharacterized protein LOC125668674 [Ostrea edulis]|uniref:uncharacterized protein LOC125668674 n=1 Tax=Ostrea edulis TaxID=37623 RepID=UPI0024AFA5FE|nr:uncharacterized protein LOC125668674 [Ostrea edulis]